MAGKNDKPLTPKQQRFVEEYLVDFNATQAATRAGYSAKVAKEQGYRLLTYAHVKAAIAAARVEVQQTSRATVAFVEEQTIELLRRCMQAEPVKRNGQPVLAETETGELAAVYEFDSAGAARALEILAKRVGFYEADNRQKHGAGLGGLTAEQRARLLERVNAIGSSGVGRRPESGRGGRTTH